MYNDQFSIFNYKTTLIMKHAERKYDLEDRLVEFSGIDDNKTFNDLLTTR